MVLAGTVDLCICFRMGLLIKQTSIYASHLYYHFSATDKTFLPSCLYSNWGVIKVVSSGVKFHLMLLESAWVGGCARACARPHMPYVKIIGQPQMPVFSFYLVWDGVSLLFTSVCGQASWPTSLWGISSFYLPFLHKNKLQTHFTVHSFTWVLGIPTQVLKLYQLSNLSIPCLDFYLKHC